MTQQEHITKLLGVHGPSLTLYFDYVDGRNLGKMITFDGFSTTTKGQKDIIFRDSSKGVDHLHCHDVIHNDIKPSNIIFDGKRAVLCDLELATEGSKLHYSGTAPYISPDLLLGHDRSMPDDIWALGVTMLFVSGLIPLPNRDWTIQDIRESESDAKFSMNAWLEEIQNVCERLPNKFSLLRHMLTEDRAKRITASQLLARLTRRPHLKVRWKTPV